MGAHNNHSCGSCRGWSNPLIGYGRASKSRIACQQVLGQAPLAVAVDVVEGAAQAGHGNAGQGGSGHHLAQSRAVGLLIWAANPRDPPSSLVSCDGVVGILDPLQQAGAMMAPPSRLGTRETAGC